MIACLKLVAIASVAMDSNCLRPMRWAMSKQGKAKQSIRLGFQDSFSRALYVLRMEFYGISTIEKPLQQI